MAVWWREFDRKLGQKKLLSKIELDKVKRFRFSRVGNELSLRSS